MMDHRTLKNASVVVVGGSAGIGFAVAEAALEEGAEVTIGGRDRDRLDEALTQLDGRVRGVIVDAKEEESLSAFFSDMPRVDHLVYTGGGGVLGPFLETPVPSLVDFFDGKFWGAYRVAKEGAPKVSPGGSITLFSGAAGERASPGFAAGSALNAAVDALVRTLAVELAPTRVNALSPGVVDTPVWDGLEGIDKTDVFSEVAATSPARRVGRAEEIAQTVLHLMTQAYATGASFRIDGGYALC